MSGYSLHVLGCDIYGSKIPGDETSAGDTPGHTSSCFLQTQFYSALSKEREEVEKLGRDRVRRKERRKWMRGGGAWEGGGPATGHY